MGGPVRADLDDFSFASLDVDYTLTRDDEGASRLRVVETFVAVFPEYDQNRGMRRSIPDAYNGQPNEPALVSITDETGAPRPAEVTQEDGVFSMTSRAADYVHGAQTYVFTYDLENVTWTFEGGGQEFYWDVNGVDWAQPFGTMTATLHVGGDLAGSLTGEQSCYRGVQDATAQCAVEVAADGEGRAVTAAAAELGPYETMTIAVGFAPDTFVLFDTSYLGSGWGWAQALSFLALIGALGWAIIVRIRRLGDEPGRPTIIAEYEPPRQVDALEAAVLLGRQPKGIPAEVLEQAIVGSIRIVEGEKRFWGKAKLRVELVDPARADGDGTMLLRGLFRGAGPGAVYEFGNQDTRFSSAAQQILSSADAELKARGLRKTVPRGTRALPIAAAVGAAALTLVFGIAALSAWVDPLWPILGFIAAGILVFAIIAVVARRPLSAEGAEVRDHLRGLQEFIEWAEADRIRMLQSPTGAERVPIATDDPREMIKLYERLLPFAVVFGQEQQWADRLMVYYGETSTVPYWYFGASAFNASSFSSSIATLSSAATASSSTSGGSSGGGSAGGGGGGGGGGGV
ncbi:DUF2207 domain-containing protein [Agromyces sp. MMS17-SY077]|uniref:DUF2207 domain-containing protein n=1 Tax=Agromyces seonyuensis TaxID=2662446 RepID=A0A6I4NV08_9MICO|nr:DUF2207 domain-containing protein [Agromyces seonyuensis]